jgi:choline dehydrogenase
LDPCFVLWQTNATGPYAQGGGFYFIARSNQSWNADADLFFLSSPGRATLGFFPGYSNGIVEPEYWSTSVVKMQVANPSGSVTLRSRDPRAAPIIDFNYFAANREVDLAALCEAAEMLFRGFDATGIPYEVVLPPRDNKAQSIMDETFSHHASSSCRMGPKNATGAEACLDSEFRVKGVKALRVVDASAWPRVPGAFPNGPTFTMSMKAAEVILNRE